MTELGHNSKKPRAGGVAVDQLKSIIARLEKLDEQKQGISDDIKDVLTEAKHNGFCVKTIRSILKIRKQDPDAREEAENTLDLYMNSLGMLPLFKGEGEAA